MRQIVKLLSWVLPPLRRVVRLLKEVTEAAAALESALQEVLKATEDGILTEKELKALAPKLSSLTKEVREAVDAAKKLLGS